MDFSFFNIFSRIFAVLFLVLANGFFVAAEFSLVALRKSRVEQMVFEGHPFAPAVQRAKKHLDTYLAATQLGITISSIALGWIGEPALAGLIEPVFSMLPYPVSFVAAHGAAIVLAFSFITILHIVIGELAPKSLALQQTERTALIIAKPLEIFLIVFKPAIHFLNSLGNVTLKMFNLSAISEEYEGISLEELKILIKSSKKAGFLSRLEQDVVESVFLLGEKRVNVVMTPRTDIFWIDAHSPSKDIYDKIKNCPYSVVLICDKELDNVTGIVEVKTLLRQQLDTHRLDIKSIMTQPIFVPENTKITQLLELYKKSKTNVALAVNEYGGIEGIVTLMDVLEAIVGYLPSHQETIPKAEVQKDGSWIVDGLMEINEFKSIFGFKALPGEDTQNFQTIGGFILKLMGKIPTSGDSVSWNGYHFKIKKMDNKRIEHILITPPRKK